MCLPVYSVTKMGAHARKQILKTVPFALFVYQEELRHGKCSIYNLQIQKSILTKTLIASKTVEIDGYSDNELENYSKGLSYIEELEVKIRSTRKQLKKIEKLQINRLLRV